MFKSFETGILDKARLISNILMLILLCGNLYFSTMFITSLHETQISTQSNNGKTVINIRSTKALKDFINKVLNQQAVSFEDRVALENDIIQIHDPVLTTAWNAFVASKTAKEGQINAVKLMSLLIDRI